MTSDQSIGSTGRAVVVLGAGALGAYVGGMLRVAGYHVVLFDKWKEHVAAIRANGLTIRDIDSSLCVELPAFHTSEFSKIAELDPQFILLTAKLTETQEFLAGLARHSSALCPVVTMQNSMVDDEVADAVGGDRVVGAIATGINVGLAGPGVVIRGSHRFSKTVFQVGELDGTASDRVAQLADMLAHVDGAAATCELRRKRWEKLGVNSLTSGVSATSGMSTSAALRADITRDLLLQLGAEFLDVAHRCGHALPGLLGIGAADWHLARSGDAQALDTVARSFEAEAARIVEGFESGMLRDMRNGRPTEVDYFSGLVARFASQANGAAPCHAGVAAFVKQMEAAQTPPSRAQLDALLGELAVQELHR